MKGKGGSPLVSEAIEFTARLSGWTLGQLALIALLTLSLVSCSSRLPSDSEVEVGLTQSEVIARWGEPHTTQEFKMPDGAFFGPQEQLTGLVAAGTQVLEWQYRSGGDINYLWFVPDPGRPEDGWELIALGTFPADAVY